jgi:outer membrane protein assembly factor BamB
MRIETMRKLNSLVPGMLLSIVLPQALPCNAEDWQQWRGTQQRGVASESAYPTEWKEGQSIAWRVAVPGAGGSTPIVAGKQAFLTSGVDGQNRLISYDLGSGKELWSAKIGTDRGAKHRKGSGANPSAVTDGVLTYAYFRSGDIAAVDFEGTIRWQKNLQDAFGEDTLWWDLGTSPLITENAVIVAVMQSGPSYVVAFDKASGDVLWQTDRVLDAPEEAAQSYATPLATKVDGKDVIAVMGADHLTLHDLESGREIGRLGGFNPKAEKYFRSIASPVISDNIIICPYSRGATLTGVNMADLIAGKGDKAIVWFRDDIGSDVPTPASLDGRVYVCGDKGMVTAIDAKTGATVWELMLPQSRHAFSSSPLVAAGNLYITREDATTFVIGPLSANEPTLLATNELADDQPFTVASMIPVDGSFLLRTKASLYRIAK